jgi:hypothetical protein
MTHGHIPLDRSSSNRERTHTYRSAPLLATILVLFGIGYTIDYNSELSCYLQTRRVTGSAPQAPQERPPLECSSSVGERKMHGIAGIGIWTIGNGCGAGDPQR